MDFVSVVYAMGSLGQGDASGQGGAGGLTAFVPLILMGVIFYFLLIRPQQKKQKEIKNMIANLAHGDLVMTSGGIQGKVTALTDTVVTVEIADKVKIKVARSFIAAVLQKAPKE